MRSYKVTVTATAGQLIAADNINRVAYINIVGNESIAVGNSTVTFATGLQLAKHSAPIHIDVPLANRCGLFVTQVKQMMFVFCYQIRISYAV